jgi:N-acetylglucosamine malate deacetylase 1
MIAQIKNKVRNLLLANPSKANYKFLLKSHSGLFDKTLSSKILESKCFNDTLQPIVMDCPQADRILVIAPHPDDDIFGAGGVLLRLAEKGAEIKTLYVTDTGNTQDTRNKIHDEAILISGKLGATAVFLGGQSGGIAEGGLEQQALTTTLRSFRPDIILTTFLLDDHVDHRQANLILTASLNATGLSPEIWSYQIYTTVIPNVVIDITAVMDQKEQLMRMWKNVSGNRDWAHYVRGMNAMNCRYLSGTEKRYGEAYFVLPAKEYIDLCNRYFSATT